MARYSRRATTEEKKNIRKATYFGILTIVALILFFFFGLPAVAKFAAFLTDIRQSSTPVDINDTTPPAPPRIQEPDRYTKEYSVEIKGNTEAGATVLLYPDGKEEELLANKDGEFTYTWSLDDGENKIYAKAKDAAGNESQESDIYYITFDDEDPELEISSPEDGKQFFGSSERQITIQGQTEGGVNLTINNRVVAVDEDGSFTFVTTLGDGENNFNFKAKDAAGNETEKDLKVHFTP